MLMMDRLWTRWTCPSPWPGARRTLPAGGFAFRCARRPESDGLAERAPIYLDPWVSRRLQKKCHRSSGHGDQSPSLACPRCKHPTLRHCREGALPCR